MNDPARTKQHLRQIMKKRRLELSEKERKQAAGAIIRPALELYRRHQPSLLALYYPLPGELDILPLADALWDRGARLLLPLTGETGGPLRFHPWERDSRLGPGPFGILQPSQTAGPELVPRMIMLPLLAFDDRGGRLGYGGGYYDRTIEKLERDGQKPLLVGLAHDFQHEAGGLRLESHDRLMDYVITPSGLRIMKK